MSMFSNGILLTQHKEPALSRKMVTLVNPHVGWHKLTTPPVRIEDLPDTDTLIRLSRDATIIDESDGTELHRKLAEFRSSTATLIVDAVDDEPYVSSKIAPLLQLQEELLGGIEICRYLCDSRRVVIMVYKHLTDIESHIPSKIQNYQVLKVRGGYPAIPSAFQFRKLGFGKRLTISVGAVIQLYRAVRDNSRQHTTFITVAGNCISRPVNMEVSLGVTVSQVLERIGLTGEPTHLVCGGPMRGFLVTQPDRTLIMPMTRAILAIRQPRGQYYEACSGCGRCEQVCPAGLNPAYLYRFVQNGYYAQLKRFDAHLCIGCGTCSYICPSRLDVAGAAGSARDYARRHYLKTGEDNAHAT